MVPFHCRTFSAALKFLESRWNIDGGQRVIRLAECNIIEIHERIFRQLLCTNVDIKGKWKNSADTSKLNL